jgi:hypothetical protein
MIEQLKQLLKSFTDGETAYAAFRDQFVRYSSVADTDAVVERLFDQAESGCAAYEHGYIDDAALRAYLTGLRRHESSNVTNTIEHFEVVTNLSAFEILAYTTTSEAASIAQVVSSNVTHNEPMRELVPA